MKLMLFLMLFPLVPAALLLRARSAALRRAVVLGAVALIMGACVMLAASQARAGQQYFSFATPLAEHLVMIAEIGLAGVFLFVCRRLPLRRAWIPLLVVAQYAPVIYFELSGQFPEARQSLFLDNLAILMALVIGIVGGCITIYTLGYMKRYHAEHPDIPDRTHQFLAAVFLFFSAMFGIVFSNNLAWIYFAWEVTTLCSFLMIGYARTEEAVHNSFRALWMLLLGGLAFAVALIMMAFTPGIQTIELGQLILKNKAVVLWPVVLLCFAGMNKAAQFPFSQWLLGAMVAPTPSSALLHSSTMVKAGVYLCLRCAPVLHDTTSGLVVALIGGITFVMASALACGQSHGKKILAYSTIANLGLIVLCAGVGSEQALWAGAMLIVFHAVAKALMFLCVGVVDQQLGSLDVEDMWGLVNRMPAVGTMMIIGMAGMFLAPFGMLISKWAVLEALALRNPLLAIFVIFGGSLMMYFWGKWMGTLVAHYREYQGEQAGIPASQWLGLGALAALTIGVCLLFPVTAVRLVQPYVESVYPAFQHDPIMSHDHLVMIFLMLSFALVLPFGFLVHWRKVRRVMPYLAGANSGGQDEFTDAMGQPRAWRPANYYLGAYMSEGRLLPLTNLATGVLWLILARGPLA